MTTLRNKQLGFSIIEAMITLIVMGFGVLALAGLQGALTRNVDVAKQRTEAVRLAQEKVEELRAYTGITSTTLAATATSTAQVSGTALNWAALAGGTDTQSATAGYATNTSFTRTWTVGGASTDAKRPISVLVSWTDRSGESQSVTINSVISQTDPADSGFLGFPLPQNTNLKRPLNRNLDIPIPAIDLGDGKSAVKFGNSGQYVKFDNVSGSVVQTCTPANLAASPSSAQVKAALTGNDANCTSINGYIVAGYVNKDSSVSTTQWSAIQSGLGISTASVTRNAAGPTSIQCQFGDAISQTDGTTIANTKYYVCIIPLSEPTPALTTNGPYNWSGTIRISGPSVWSSSGNSYFVCRYQYATNSTTDVNQANTQPYVNVNKSIDQQNYLIATTSNGTSSTTPTCPSDMTQAGVSTGVLHQDCRSASNPSNYATACPSSSAGATYTVTYNGNGNTSGSVPTDSSSPYTAGSTVTALGSGSLAKSGATFANWNTQANGAGTNVLVGGTFTINNDTVLYAKWNTTTTNYTLTYDANLGSNAPVDPSSPYASSTLATVLGAGSMTRSGYAFNGWNTQANGTGTPYSAGTSITMSANTVLYAQWSVATTYSVTYNGNTNTSGSVPTDSNAYVTNATATLLGKADLAKTNSTFMGWNTNSGGTGTTYQPGATLTVSGNVTLYAKWAANVQLSTPAPTWSGNTLSFPVTDASSYDLYSCKTTGNNNLTSCTPSTASNQTSSSVTSTPANKETYCYKVVAKGTLPYTDSAASVVKCIHLQGSTYTRQ